MTERYQILDINGDVVNTIIATDDFIAESGLIALKIVPEPDAPPEADAPSDEVK